MAVTENNSSKFKKCALAIAIASCMSLATSAAEAAGLGKLTILSSLGQPLKAEVEISATGEELVGMTARLAPQDVFKQAGVDYASSLQDLRFAVERRANGKSVLKLSSARPVNEPFLDFLVELTWPSGRLVREYTFLLDPPEFASGQGMRSSVDAKIVETVRGGGAMPEPRVQRQPPAPQKPPVVTADASPARSAAEKPATADKAGSATRMVERGDTLRKIAAESQYANVSLEQMLVGLYRNNRDAFIGNDINRLKAGVILNIPDQASVAAVSEKDARHVYVASGDFAAYRRKLAAAAATGTRSDAPATQSAGGRITPKVEEKTPAVDPAKDQVKVARADAPAAADVERVAAEKALQEAQARLASLERNVGELQKLLEMKNQRLAELEKPVAPVPEVKPPEVPAQQAAPEGGARIVDAQVPAAAAEATVSPLPATPQEAPVIEKKPPVPPPVVADVPLPEEPGLLDSLMENPLPLAGGAAAIALLTGLLLYRRRKVDNSSMQTTAAPSPSSLGPNSVFRMTGGQSVDTGSTPPHTGEFSQAGPGTIDTDEVDPVAEADVYMAYGRDAQAEEILLEAMQKDPNRLAIHAKLLEIYANRRSLKQFETLAGELYAQTAGLGPEWEKVAALGAEIDPENPLYGGVSQAAKPVQARAFDPDATLVVKPGQVAASTAAGLMVGDLAEPFPVAAAVAEDELVSLVSGAPDEPVDEPSPLGDTQIRETPILDQVPSEDEQLQVDDGMSLDFDLGDPVQPAAEIVEEPYVDTVVTADSSPDALDFDLGGMAGVAPELAGLDNAPVAADSFQAPVADLPSLDLPVADALAEPDDFGGLDATPDFSPEGTLVISSGPGFGQSVNTDFELDDVPATAGFAVSEDVLPEPAAEDEPSIAEEVEDLSELVPVEPPAAAAPLPVGKHDDEDLVMDAPDLVNTVVNPVAGNIDDMDFDVKLSDSVFLGQPMMASEFDIGSINLDLAAEPVAEEAPAPVADLPEPKAAPAAEVHDAQWEEVNTKLDLAKAYEEMGDLEGARELLQEVLGEGSADLVAEAETILGRLGG